MVTNKLQKKGDSSCLLATIDDLKSKKSHIFGFVESPSPSHDEVQDPLIKALVESSIENNEQILKTNKTLQKSIDSQAKTNKLLLLLNAQDKTHKAQANTNKMFSKAIATNTADIATLKTDVQSARMDLDLICASYYYGTPAKDHLKFF